MKIAVVGSRNFKNIERFEKEMIKEFSLLDFPSRMDSKFTNKTLITGGAKGVDSWAIGFAFKEDIFCEVIKPINPANKLDYLFRNIEIIVKADKILAFWDGKSKGTKFVIDYAKARNKDVEVFKEA